MTSNEAINRKIYVIVSIKDLLGFVEHKENAAVGEP